MQGIVRTVSPSVVVCLSAVLFACATPNVKTDYSLDQNPEKGLIVGSISTNLDDSVYEGTSKISFSGVNGGKSGFFKVESSSISGAPETDFSDANGKIIAISVPAGKYKLKFWSIDNGSGAIIKPRKSPVPLYFKVNREKATYIGNVHVELETGRNMFGITIISGGWPIISDKRERDIPVLLAKYPELSKQDIRMDPLPEGPWLLKGMEDPSELEAGGQR